MVSIGIILTSSMRSNLSSLRTIAAQMDKTQNILSTGKKVNSAIDNASSYYQARSLSNRAADLNSLLDDMGKGIQVLQAANEGIKGATAYLEQMKSLAEQASTLGTVEETRTIKLTDNSSSLAANGYAAVRTADEFMSLLQQGVNKVVLMNDIELENYFYFEASNVTINGGGHTLKHNNFDVYGEGVTIENMNIEYKGHNQALYVDGRDFTLKNVNIDYEGTYKNANVLYLGYGGLIENVSIEAKSTSLLVGIDSNGLLNINKLNMDLSTEKKGSISGIYNFGDVNIKDISMNIQGENVTGI